MKAISATLLLLLFAVRPSFAEFYTGNVLVGSMREYEKAVRNDPSRDLRLATAFTEFIAGVYDSREMDFCTPERTTLGQIAAVVSKYLNAHPEQWNQAAYLLVLLALKEAFPCSPSGR